MSWALVTGGAKRIGREIALELARGGWDIILHYNTSRHEALKAAKDIRALGQRACLAALDLGNLWLVGKLIPALAAELGPIKALVNNAALFVPDRLDKKNLHEKINAEAPWILSEALYRQLPRRAEGVIVNMLDADPVMPEFMHYNESKLMLAAMTHCMAAHYAPRLRVNGIALGPVLPSPRQSRAHFNKLVENTALKKPVALDDVARTVRFAVENVSMTGAIIPLGGKLK